MLRYKTLVLTAWAVLLLGPSLSLSAQNQELPRPQLPRTGQPPGLMYDDLRAFTVGHYPGSPTDSPFANGQTTYSLAETARRAQAESEARKRADDENAEYARRRRVAQQEAIRAQLMETQAHADPEAPDQSELLKNSHDRDFILHNFRTMYVEAHDAEYFGSQQMKAALGGNKEFQKLNIRIVDDPRVADTVLKVSYTFAWDYPFELRHQNTTFVLVAGKGEGPFSGPLGAADVARQFVNAVKEWRVVKKAP
jgi:hypothetical protein